MAKNIRVSDTLYALAQAEANAHDRSIAQQIEHWAKLGFALAHQSDARSLAIEAARQRTFALDRMAVEAGQAKAGDFDFLGDEFVAGATFAFPAEYRRTAKR